MPRQYDTFTGQREPYDPDANITVRHGTENDGKALATDIFDWLFERAPKAISRKPTAVILAADHLPIINDVGSI
jgi:hypothetical protein